MELKGIRAEEKIRTLVAFVVEGKEKGKNLSELFEDYAKKHGKAKGSIRNLYYEILREGRKNPAFYQKHLEGKGLRAEEIREFEGDEADRVIKSILLASALKMVLHISYPFPQTNCVGKFCCIWLKIKGC